MIYLCWFLINLNSILLLMFCFVVILNFLFNNENAFTFFGKILLFIYEFQLLLVILYNYLNKDYFYSFLSLVAFILFNLLNRKVNKESEM